MRASRGAAPKRPTEPRRAESWSGVVKLTIRAQSWYASGAVFMQLGKVMRVLVAAQDRSNASRYKLVGIPLKIQFDFPGTRSDLHLVWRLNCEMSFEKFICKRLILRRNSTKFDDFLLGV